MVEQQDAVIDTTQQCYTLTIARLNEFYVLNPDIKVSDASGVISCAIPNGENKALTLPANTYNLHFQGLGCKATATVNLTQNTTIVLKYNRLLGGLEVYVNDVKQNQSSTKPRLIIGIVCAIVVACFVVPWLLLSVGDNGTGMPSNLPTVTEDGTPIVETSLEQLVAYPGDYFFQYVRINYACTIRSNDLRRKSIYLDNDSLSGLRVEAFYSGLPYEADCLLLDFPTLVYVEGEFIPFQDDVTRGYIQIEQLYLAE